MSSKGQVIPRGLVAVRPREGAKPGSPALAPTAPGGLVDARDLAAIREEAFERGRQHERQHAAKLFAQGALTLDREAVRLSTSRSSDKEILRDFAVRLSCLIAEELVATLVQADAHDLRGMVTRVLDQVLPEFSGDKVLLQVHPEDLSLISNEFLREIGAASVRVVPNPALPRAGLRVVGAGAEFYSGVHERLEAVKQALLTDRLGADDARA